MNQKEARKLLQQHGMTFRRITETREYRVAHLEDGRDSERCAYYSDDMRDAVNTGIAMAVGRKDK